MKSRLKLRRLCLLGAVLLAGCTSSGDAERLVDFALRPLNGSGVGGSVTLTQLPEGRTLVEIEVDPAGHSSMPAHIHPGSCAELVPQPKYALENVLDGSSTTEVPASLDELLAGNQAVNLHRSNQEMDVYTACVDLP
ncbi:MAG: hypothetical protein ACRDGD_10790 [Candidatus Limnocylindria bacterium]